MKRGLRITLSIFLPLIINIAFIIFMVMKDSECEQKVFRLDIENQNFYLYLIWVVLQIIIVGLIFFKSNHRKQIIALPIIALLFATLFTTWFVDLKDNNYDKFDKEIWKKPNHFFRINYVEDIVSNNRLENKCYDEIVEMLGKPNTENGEIMEYDLGFGIMTVKLKENCFDQIEIKCK